MVIPEEWFPLKDVVLTLTKKSCLSCELNVSLELLNLRDLNEIIEKIILKPQFEPTERLQFSQGSCRQGRYHLREGKLGDRWYNGKVVLHPFG